MSPYLRRRLRSLEEINSQARVEGSTDAPNPLAARRSASGSIGAVTSVVVASGIVAGGADGDAGDARAVSAAATSR